MKIDTPSPPLVMLITLNHTASEGRRRGEGGEEAMEGEVEVEVEGEGRGEGEVEVEGGGEGREKERER